MLSTAREIIFLWVARMVMMGLEFLGEVPFDDVYIHSVIQAADGRRMSKSLGTGIDPLEMIAKYGADATRFALLLMSSSQDVRFSEEKILMGRAFANKLWNASRLVLLASEGHTARRSDADQVDRWITSRLQRCLTAVETAVGAFDFADAVDTLYHFVWDEFCDWYLELVKVRLYGADQDVKAQAAGHARWMLDQIVRLLHPFLPFVTEEVAAAVGAAPLLGSGIPCTTKRWLGPTRPPWPSCRPWSTRCGVFARRPRRRPARCWTRCSSATTPRRARPAPRRRPRRPRDGGFRGRALRSIRVGAARPGAHRGAFRGRRRAGRHGGVVPGGRLEVAAAVDKAEELARLEEQLAKIAVEVTSMTRCTLRMLISQPLWHSFWAITSGEASGSRKRCRITWRTTSAVRR